MATVAAPEYWIRHSRYVPRIVMQVIPGVHGWCKTFDDSGLENCAAFCPSTMAEAQAGSSAAMIDSSIRKMARRHDR